jgi:preprotein translocase subunit SecA
LGIIDKIFGTYSSRELKHVEPIKNSVLALEEKFSNMSDAELKNMTVVLKERLAQGQTLDDILPEAFATCREAAFRVLNMKHFPVQIIGGIVLHQGRICEMRTGEGKTLVATLAAYLNALDGKGVHVVTVNDYLARRDAEWMGKVYNFLGLTVGVVVHGVDNQERQDAYNCDITYGTNNEFGFDYLRDNMVIYKGEKVQRDHNFAIVDEVDSILIDEARTPLIISGQGDKSTDLYVRADKFAKTLTVHKVTELDDKVDNDINIDADYIVDEKAKTATLTPSGVKKAESYFNVENLMDADNMTLLHHVNQAVKAYGIMKADIDYVVNDGEVLIVDEFTGRLMIGRRYNEGLHQAIEAKEGVKVERESKTLATITFQNYFRLFKKLAGMTGTATTEEAEFREIYKLDVIEIPTNRDVMRTDHQDAIFKNEMGKYNAAIDQIVECNKIGQPVLVGTISIERSELLSSMLKKRGIKHQVLNAKYHEKEAEIIAQAGKLGAVTIATNMAGRGTDIVLGGNAEFLAKTELRKKGFPEELIAESNSFANTDDEEILEVRKLYAELNKKHKQEIEIEAKKVCEVGGLFILGTERHESRRIDNQLRGRAGRQGDPGESRFFLSLEDDLMRLFGGERVQNMMSILKIEDDQPIENKLLTNTIESAQRKVEGRNFGIRKSVLQFDDVMNRQRELIYGQRSKVLDGENLRDYIISMIKDMITSAVDLYLPDIEVHDNWNIEGLRDHFIGVITNENDLRYTIHELSSIEKSEIAQELTDRAIALYEKREEELGQEVIRELERVILLKIVDTKWMDHIDQMDELRRGIYLRAYGQKDPVVEYRLEGFDMFDEMIDSIREDTVRMMLTVQVNTEKEPKREQVAKPMVESLGGERVATKTVTKKDKVGRNDVCPCGSGKKYKKCCGQ